MFQVTMLHYCSLEVEILDSNTQIDKKREYYRPRITAFRQDGETLAS